MRKNHHLQGHRKLSTYLPLDFKLSLFNSQLLNQTKTVGYFNMNRGDGLKQRRNVVKENETSVSKSNSDDEENQEELGANGVDEDQDSKETRLTLMEEVLLLGLKDKEVCLINLTSLKWKYFS